MSEVWIVESGFRYEGYSIDGVFDNEKEAFELAELLYLDRGEFPDDTLVTQWTPGRQKPDQSWFKGGSFERSDWDPPRPSALEDLAEVASEED